MTRIQSLLKNLAVWGVVLSAVSALAADNVVQTSARVVRIKGNARYKVGAGEWQTLKRGDQIKAGTIVETAVESHVDLMLGEGTAPVAKPVVGEVLTYTPAAEQNMIRIWPNSRLAFDKLSRTETGAEPVTETQVDLQAGRIFGSVKKMTAASKYEVKLPNGVAGIRGTTFDISVEGVIACLTGSIYVTYVNSAGQTESQVVMSDQKFDIRTGTLSQLTQQDRVAMLSAQSTIQVEAKSTEPLVYTVDNTLVIISPH